MRDRLWGISCLTLALIVPAAPGGKAGDAVSQPGSRETEAFLETPGVSDCGRCHTCDSPTTRHPCLVFSCTRHKPWRNARYRIDQPAPDVVILDELADAYLPVPFDHKGHAEMAEMGEGCVTCHHYTPAGQQHPACKTCHDISADMADIDKPALRGAYHQQCLNCHREWMNEKDCDACHLAKTGNAKDNRTALSPTKDDLLGRMHPPIPEPDGDTYRSTSRRLPGWSVIFRHRDHVHRFGLKCVDCHHERSCARCHTKDTEQARSHAIAEHHASCVRCHKHDMDLSGRHAGRCERCHWREDRPSPERFDHGSTGWPLNRFHQATSCRSCHISVPFAKLDRDCNSCHSDWSPTVFDHRVTGQVLDVDHVDIDCEECHTKRRYDRPPTCDECHDEDEGIAFPAERPGPITE